MRIIYLANVRLPTERAYGIQIISMCQGFASVGADVLLLFPYRMSRAIKEDVFGYYSVSKNFKAKRIPALDFYLPGVLNSGAFHVKNFLSALSLGVRALYSGADLIYSRDELLIYLLSFFKNNLCLEVHKFSSARSMFYRRFKRNKTRMVAITQALKKEFMDAGFLESSILVAPDAVDIEKFNLDVSQEEARSRTGLTGKNHIVMYAGHLFERKGAGVLAQAARSLPEVSFVFVGGTDHEIQEFKNTYSDTSNILILGRKSHGEMPLYLKAADILALPNSAKPGVADTFTSPLKLFEYMASKRAIIASDIPVLREILNSKNALLIEPDQPLAWTRGISDLLADKELQRLLAQQAFEDVSVHDWKDRAQRILSYLTS